MRGGGGGGTAGKSKPTEQTLLQLVKEENVTKLSLLFETVGAFDISQSRFKNNTVCDYVALGCP